MGKEKVTPFSNKMVLRYAAIIMEKVVYTKRTWQRSRDLSGVWLAFACLLFFGAAGVTLNLMPATRVFRMCCGDLRPAGEPADNAISVRADEKQRVVLDDGSTVVMNADSELSFARDFNGRTREVNLRGEAFFDVQDDPSKPFRVKALHMTVVGTVFDVKTQGDSLLINAMGGAVQVGDSTGAWFEVKPRHEVVINTESLEHGSSTLDNRGEKFWETEYLMLGEVTFGEAMRRISRKFDVKIEVGNAALMDCVIHTEIHPGEEMRPIVEVLSKAVNAQVVRNGDHIRIKGGTCR